ncbi:RNA-guided endonuclease InsQ/TnpB family protein [Streptosporangium saharense]|uniref:RNA-guided endonuclease InsQ/TnpB family protein n=1 Tax=Streptosporangium saharense TaxID=1706840 RepID=UPI003696E5DD
MRTAYKCRAYPTPEQAAALNRTFGSVRFVWNRTLAWRHTRYHGEQAKTNFTQANAYLTAMKATDELAWLNEVSSVPLQQAIRHQQVAFTNFFAGHARYPRYKSRAGRQSAEYTRSAFRYRDGVLTLAFAWSWPCIDPDTIDPTTVTVSLAADVATPEQAPATGVVVGVDMGITDFAVTSDGEKIANPRHLAKRERNLARYQRRMARKQRGGANRAKAKAKVARAHRKVRAARADFLHKMSARLVRDHDVIVIDRWFPSSKTCSACGHLLAGLSLSTRRWTCPGCGTLHDRDVNAAKNILAAGLAVSARGADVRPQGPSLRQSAVKREAPPARVGIPLL